MPAIDAQLVRESYEAVASSMPGFAAAFYDRLFRAAPGVRPMFPADMSRQQQHLAAAVAIVARNADRLDDLGGTLRELGARHAEFGTRPEHYTLVVDVLLETLASAAGPSWTARTGMAWRTLLERVSAFMIEGAEAREENFEIDRLGRTGTTH